MKKITILFLLFSGYSFSQKVDLSYYLPVEKYNDVIPKPKDIIGHEVGEWHLTHDKLVEYMKVLSASSDRISIENRGTTYEGRPLILLTITSPENHKNLEKIKQNHRAATNDATIDISNHPIVVNQWFYIHGNESSGSNAALEIAYYLSASDTEATIELLKNNIILFDSYFNHDGLQRFSYWANSNKN